MPYMTFLLKSAVHAGSRRPCSRCPCTVINVLFSNHFLWHTSPKLLNPFCECLNLSVTYFEMGMVKTARIGQRSIEVLQWIIKIFWKPASQFFERFSFSVFIDIDHKTAGIKCAEIVLAADIPAQALQ